MVAIKKILRLARVGRFIDYAASGDVEFQRVNLLYGENAKGKSTLTAVFRALGSGDDAALRGRKTLGDERDQEINILTSMGSRRYAKMAWDGHQPNVAVFDQTFVSDNIYAGDAVGTSQRRNLYRVIVGERAVALAKELDDLTSSNRQMANELRSARQSLSPFLPSGMQEAEFLAFEPTEAIELEIRKVQQKLADANNASAIVDQSNLHYIDRFELEDWYLDLLKRTLPDIEADAEAKLRAHLQKHAMRTHGEEWLVQGLDFSLDQGCPFCGQNINGSTILTTYQTLFSDAYRKLREQVADAMKGVAPRLGERRIAEARLAFTENKKLREFWGARVELPDLESFDVDELAKVASDMGGYAHRAFQKKLSAPLEPVELEREALESIAALSRLNLAIDAYNSTINSANNPIIRFKSEFKPTDVQILRERLANLRQMVARNTPAIDSLCRRVVDLESNRLTQEQRKPELRTELDQISDSMIGTYQDRINELLENFGASFSLGAVGYNYVGGVNASFDVMIRRKPVSIGTADTPTDQPSFKNTLSSGDKSTLALAFFLAQLEQDPLRKQRVVVLDDPFSSQDRFRRNQTAIEIAYLAQEVAQVVLLSHDAGFLADVDKKLVDLKSKSLRLVAIGEDQSAIVECTLQNLVRQPIHGWIESLQRYSREGATTNMRSEDIVQKIRPLLEAHCRNCCPGRFEDADILSSMIGKIRAEGETHRLHPSLRALSDIHDFSKKYHHDDDSVTGAVDDGELAAYVRRTLRVVTGL